jgi:hypothetical protein
MPGGGQFTRCSPGGDPLVGQYRNSIAHPIVTFVRPSEPIGERRERMPKLPQGKTAGRVAARACGVERRVRKNT